MLIYEWKREYVWCKISRVPITPPPPPPPRVHFILCDLAHNCFHLTWCDDATTTTRRLLFTKRRRCKGAAHIKWMNVCNKCFALRLSPLLYLWPCACARSRLIYQIIKKHAAGFQEFNRNSKIKLTLFDSISWKISALPLTTLTKI